MVDDERRTPLEGLARGQRGGPPDHLEVEGGVETPPHLLEDLGERGRGARRRRHPPGEGRVQVVVAADERGGAGARRAHASSSTGPASTRIGRSVRQVPSHAWRAAATAPAVGTRPISPTPLIPYGARGW